MPVPCSYVMHISARADRCILIIGQCELAVWEQTNEAESEWEFKVVTVRRNSVSDFSTMDSTSQSSTDSTDRRGHFYYEVIPILTLKIISIRYNTVYPNTDIREHHYSALVWQIRLQTSLQFCHICQTTEIENKCRHLFVENDVLMEPYGKMMMQCP